MLIVALTNNGGIVLHLVEWETVRGPRIESQDICGLFGRCFGWFTTLCCLNRRSSMFVESIGNRQYYHA